MQICGMHDTDDAFAHEPTYLDRDAKLSWRSCVLI